LGIIIEFSLEISSSFHFYFVTHAFLVFLFSVFQVYVCLGKQGATEGVYHLYVLDLGKLERTNRKTQRLAMVDRVIRADAEGVLRDEDGQAYNEGC